MIDPGSLSQTLDAVADAALHRELPSRGERQRTARWIAERQGLAGAYADTFAGFPHELERGILVFTGERITSASARHILGEEACRALRLLDVADAPVQAALARADAGLAACLERAAADSRHANPGRFCCCKCSVGLWRNLLSGGLDRGEERLRKGVGEYLRGHRTDDDKWRTFPFWYTVLALAEMAEVELPEARAELRHVAPVLGRTAKRAAPASVYAARRHALAARALSKV